MNLRSMPNWLLWVGGGAVAYGAYSYLSTGPKILQLTDARSEDPVGITVAEIKYICLSDKLRSQGEAVQHMTDLYLIGRKRPLSVLEPPERVAPMLPSFRHARRPEDVARHDCLVNPALVTESKPSNWNDPETQQPYTKLIFPDGSHLLVRSR